MHSFLRVIGHLSFDISVFLSNLYEKLKMKANNIPVKCSFPHILHPIPMLFVMSIFFSGCFGTKTITLDNRAITKKEYILLYQNENVYEVRNFNFNINDLTGELWESTFNDLPKSKKVKYLEVYVDSVYNFNTTDNNNLISIPYSSINKIAKTRFRAEYGLLVIPIWFFGGLIIYYGGALL